MTAIEEGIRALVVDDEALARRNVIVLLRDDPDIGAIEECGFGVEAEQQRSNKFFVETRHAKS